jgi:formylglycine-generating enzyme required for sulfatase activity
MRRRTTLSFIAAIMVWALLGIGWGLSGQENQAAGRKLAFLVGVREYRHNDLKNLDYPENDVEELAKVLEKQSFSVTVLTTRAGRTDKERFPDAANIRRQLAAILKDASKNDLIVVGLAGHGLQPLGSSQSYFCPFDANPSARGGKLVNPDSLLSISEILTQLRESGIGEKLLLVDACRNDPQVRGARRGVTQVDVSSLPEQTGVLLSCRAGEFSFESKSYGTGHGAFFYEVIEGLRGGANFEDNEVTWESLRSFVRKRVPVKVREVFGKDGGAQNPNEIGNLNGAPIVLARIEPARIESPSSKPATPPTMRSENRPANESPPSSNVLTNSIGMKLALLPAGEFLMGAAGGEEKAGDDEKPQHRVKITKPFYLGTYEVTQGEFARVMGRNPSKFSPNGESSKDVTGQDTSRFPVENVSWFDAVEYCNKLSERDKREPYYELASVERNDDGSIKSALVMAKAGTGYRLPTEAEWEYACRAGTSTPFHFGTSLNGADANSDGNSPYGTTEKGKYLSRTTTVGSYRANAFGLYDMHGNVWEWCWDWYDTEYYGKSPDVDSRGPESGSLRVYRGGGWNAFAVLCRAAYRGWLSPAGRYDFLGFRLARSSEE